MRQLEAIKLCQAEPRNHLGGGHFFFRAGGSRPLSAGRTFKPIK